MSEVKTDKLTGVGTAGSIVVTGEGNSTTTNLQQGLCKVWCDLDGTGTIAIDDSFNCASATDNGTGDYTIAYTNSISNANYSLTGAASNRRVVVIISRAAGNTNLYSQDHNDGTNEADADPFCFHICGDLA